MPAMPLPPNSATLSHLHRADGSATYSANGYTVIAAVNGPIEVQRRDELPEEAAIDVVVRPAAGVGSTRERHLESLIHNTLRSVVLVQNYPRTLIQVTLQITSTPVDDSVIGRGPQGSTGLPLLACLLQTTMLALLSASLAMCTTFTSTLLALTPSGQITENPDAQALKKASSIHVYAFTSKRELLVAQSEGRFEWDTWQLAHDRALQICCGGESEADAMQIEEAEGGLEGFMRGLVKGQLEKEQGWKEEAK
ncbi:MAG: exosome non-catalytic core subunit rrp46 [Cirrosporium novae-zelandiae]|nr:MAG: exosome non-catalytic core subunit rrp46 [Cirrosporium novae-zelandiae]